MSAQNNGSALAEGSGSAQQWSADMRQYIAAVADDDDDPWGPILEIIDDPSNDGRPHQAERAAR